MALLVRWIPWVLSAAALGFFLWVSPAGLVLAGGWGIVLLLVRGFTALFPARRTRLWIDAAFGAACFLAAFEGGWYLIPAVAAFAVSDWWSGRRSLVKAKRA